MILSFYHSEATKVQRYALSVIEAPTGNKEDDDLEFENMSWNGSDTDSFSLPTNCLIKCFWRF